MKAADLTNPFKKVCREKVKTDTIWLKPILNKKLAWCLIVVNDME